MTVKLLEIDGELRTIGAWAELYGIPARLVHDRIAAGWEPWRAVKVMPRDYANPIAVGDECLTIRQWADRLGCDSRAIHDRLARGWDPDRAVTTPIRKRRVA